MFLVVTGGSGSGKSEYAEDRLTELVREEAGEIPMPAYYIATMCPLDEESHRRISRHRAMRAGKHFQTIEKYTGLKELELPARSGVLLECMSNLTANEMYQEQGAKERTVEEIMAGVRLLAHGCRHLVVVTNEIFSDGVDYGEETRRYQAFLGEINRRMAAMADEVWEVVYGIPIGIEKKEICHENSVEQL